MNWRKRTYHSHGFGGQIVFHFSGYSKSLLKPKKSRPSPFIFLSSNFSDRITWPLCEVSTFWVTLFTFTNNRTGQIVKPYPSTYLKLNWEEEMRTPSRFPGLTSSEMETPGFGELGERTCGYFHILWVYVPIWAIFAASHPFSKENDGSRVIYLILSFWSKIWAFYSGLSISI